MAGSVRLSPEKWHEKVPREWRGNLRLRHRLLTEADGNRQKQRALRLACKEDILFYINTFVWQFNPKKKGEQVGPFITWDYQEDALMARPETWDGDLNRPEKGILWCFEHDRTAVIEKSREMGASWLFLIFQDWLCLFHEYTQTLNISRSADAVDCKSPDSLFWKLRFMHARLPGWLRGEIVEQSMYMEYKESRSWATGEASTGRAGVGGRAAVIFVDEFSQIKEDTEVRQRTANTADCRFFNGTHLGTETEFYRLTDSPEIVKIVMHWSQHPDKKKGLYKFDPVTNKIVVLDTSYEFPADYQFVYEALPAGGPYPGLRSPWYDWKCGDIGSNRGVAMELDINPEGSVSQFISKPEQLVSLIRTYCRSADWRGKVMYDPDTGRPAGLVQDSAGPLSLWLLPRPDGGMPRGLYKIGSDLSSGVGATNSCLSIVLATTGEKIGEYVTPFVLPDQMAYLAIALGWLFKTEAGEGAQIVWEKRGPGTVYGNKLVELGYGNIYRVLRASRKLQFSDTEPGWNPTVDNKRVLLEDYRAALLSRQFLNRSEVALREFFQFKYQRDGSVVHSGEESRDEPSGARANHGDRVIADALAWMLSKPCWAVAKKTELKEAPILSLAWRREMWAEKNREKEDAY